MGFYGNITNTARTQFQFDLVYPNRYQMELKTYTDNIYAGRYILIEYDKEPIVDSTVMTEFYPSVSGNHIIGSLTKGGTPIKIGYNGTAPQIGDLFYTVEIKEVAPGAGAKTTTAIYVVDSGNPGQNAHFRMATDSDDNYVKNYNIDVAHYGPGRGYDSTVWQKVYSEGQEKYVMVAELNTVVPTFDVAADAPTMNPIIPHFDANSTDVYYKLHWQAPWGFRIKEDNTHSDEQTVHTTYLYDAENNTHTKSEKTVNAAIYYNKPAFDAQVGVSPAQIKKHSNATDKINLNLAASGNLYNKHDGSADMSVQNDIQELTINLPSIGNMMSDAWDIIHGPNRNDDMRQVDENGNYVGSLQGRLDSIDAITVNTIPVKVDPDGKLVGTKINGDSQRVVAAEGILNEELSTSFDQDDAWIYTKINSSNTPNGIAIHHTFHAKADTTSTSNVNGNGNDIYLYTPKVDKAGHVVGKNIETVTLPFGFKYIKTNGSSTVTTNPSVNTKTIEADNTQDTMDINTANKWIRIANSNDTMTIGHEVHTITTSDKSQTDLNDGTDTITIQDTVYDAAGHVTANQKHTYVLPYGYKTISSNCRNNEEETKNHDGAKSASTTADNTQDTLNLNSGNYWTRIDVSDDTVVLSHSVRDIDVTSNGTTNLNTESGAIDENNINIPDFEYDAAGHIISKKDHNYTLPYGFKTIKTNGRSTAEAENATSTPTTVNIVADKTQDDLTINSGNKWIRIDSNASADSLTISHDIHNTSSTTSEQTLSSETAVTTFEVPTYSFDKAGHYTSHDTKTITMPFGYGKISGDSGNTAATATFDEVTFTSDEWLTATVSKDKVTYSHDYPNKEADTTSSSNMNDSNSNAIVLETLKRDDKGHVIAVNEHTVILPYGYKTFTGDTGSTSAKNTQDSVSITGDNWISSVVSDDAISITHKNPVVGTATAKDNVNPNFGDTFTVEDHYFDNKGHKFETKTHTVKIPQPSLTPGEGNVVTGLALIPATGAMTETKALLGTITLGTYENSDNSDDLTADISLQNALRRLQNKNANTNQALTDEVDARKAADEALQENINSTNVRIDNLIGGESLNEAFNTLQKVSDWMSTNDTDADKVIDDIATLNGDDTVEGSVKKQLKDSIEALDVEDIAVEGQYVSAVNEVNGKVVITRADLPVLGSAAYEDAENFAPATILEDAQFPYAADEMDAAFTRMTIAELFTVVAQLSNQVALLQEEINTLKAYHEPVIDEEETPTEP